MMEPSGPLPPAVYRRRRVAAALAAVVGLVLVVWALGALLSGSTERQRPAGAAAGTATQRQQGPNELAQPAARSSSPSPSSRPPSASQPPPSSGPQRPAVAKPKPQPKPKPKPCGRAALRVRASADRADYRAGQRPELTMSVTNTSAASCTANVGRSARELAVTTADGDKHVWSSTDCYFGDDKPQRRTLQPDKPRSYGLSWTARGSTPGCAGQRGAVAEGSYQVTGTVAGVTSAPVGFRIGD